MITHMSWTHDGDDKENGKKVACLEVAGERENGRARGRHARGDVFSRAHYFQAPATQATETWTMTAEGNRSVVENCAHLRQVFLFLFQWYINMPKSLPSKVDVCFSATQAHAKD